MSIFDTPLLTHLLRSVSRIVLRCLYWQTTGEKPSIKKFVLIAAPHTSNWDLFYMLLIAFDYKLKIHWMGKSTLFRFPWKNFMVWLGGIPVDRSKSNNTVEEIVKVFCQNQEFVLAIPPEGTRSKTQCWKTGFYHIAMGAEIPICLGYLDYKHKKGGIGSLFYPSGNLESDLHEIKKFYHSIQGRNT